MDFITGHLLSLILFLPIVTAVVVLVLPGDRPQSLRWTAFAGSLIPFGLSLVLWAQFDLSAPGFQFEEQANWYTALNASYHLGVDGISLTMVMLSTLLTPLAILASFNITEKVKAYMALFLMLETGMLGVFFALDLMLFFVFWEVGLIPMYFLIAQWGGKNRDYASLKFMLFTIAGSLGLLLAIQLIGVVSGTFDMPALFEIWPALTEGMLMGLPVATVKSLAFWAFVVAFAVKVPVWPVHTWLPDAHTEAPTAGSMILAGVLLKLGAYGFLRLILPLYPAEAKQYAVWLAALGTLSIIFGALSAAGQTDFKRLVAYSSINHMGFVVLGIAAAALAAGTEHAHIAMNGVILQMFNHGVSAAGMFFLVGVIYDRTHSRDMRELGGFWRNAPIYGSVLIFTSMASLGLPGLNGFVSEFLVVRGAWPVFTAATALSTIGLFFTGVYVLKGIRGVLLGLIKRKWFTLDCEMNTRELVVIAPLLALMLVIGFWPMWILDVINQAVMMWF
jgi:NADH-quinone oxidoreductase subunit M